MADPFLPEVHSSRVLPYRLAVLCLCPRARNLLAVATPLASSRVLGAAGSWLAGHLSWLGPGKPLLLCSHLSGRPVITSSWEKGRWGRPQGPGVLTLDESCPMQTERRGCWFTGESAIPSQERATAANIPFPGPASASVAVRDWGVLGAPGDCSPPGQQLGGPRMQHPASAGLAVPRAVGSWANDSPSLCLGLFLLKGERWQCLPPAVTTRS